MVDRVTAAFSVQMHAVQKLHMIEHGCRERLHVCTWVHMVLQITHQGSVLATQPESESSCCVFFKSSKAEL